MPAEVKFSAKRIRERINDAIERRKAALIAQLFYIGEECLANARANHLYLNQTGNLCSSIGYCVIVDGEIVGEKFFDKSDGQGGIKNGADGMQKGMEYLHQLATEQPTEGITFLMVAGMPYAQYVEAMSLDVLDTSEQMAKAKIKSMIDRLFTTKAA